MARDKMFVALQLLLFALYVWDPVHMTRHNNALLLVLGVLMMIVGAVFIFWSAWQIRRHVTMYPTPKEGAQLMTNGAFRFMRHPIYSGIIAMALGFGMAEYNIGRMAMGFVLWLFFTWKTNYEEQKLMQQFPAYSDYKNRTNKFFPTFKL